MRKCYKCKENKPDEDFHWKVKAKGWRSSYCKVCDRQAKKLRTQKWREANPEAYQLQNLTNRINYLYGLTYEKYMSMIAKGCAVCGSLDEPCIDHDHSCCKGARSCGGCIRGVLCKRHNKTLGYVQDSIQELQSLIDYLQK